MIVDLVFPESEAKIVARPANRGDNKPRAMWGREIVAKWSWRSLNVKQIVPIPPKLSTPNRPAGIDQVKIDLVLEGVVRI